MSSEGSKKKKKIPEMTSEQLRHNLLHRPGVAVNVNLAVCYIEDALEGRCVHHNVLSKFVLSDVSMAVCFMHRLANGKGKMYTRSPWIQRLFLFQINDVRRVVAWTQCIPL